MNNLNEYFDCIYCINLLHRKDRLDQFKKDNLSILGTSILQVFKAIDGNDLTDPDWQYSRGALGCRLSHLAVYKDAVAKKYSKIIVLEDDVILSKHLKESLFDVIKITNHDWDMIYLGGTHYLKPDKVNENVVKLNGTLALHAVAINCRCLEEIISKIETDKRWVDSVIGDLHVKLKVYGFLKPLAMQRKGYSDIQEKYINYNISFLTKLTYKIKDMVKVFLHYFVKI